MNERQKEEIKAVILLAICVLSFLSLLSFNNHDVSFFTSNVNLKASNLIGRAGAYFAWTLLISLGYAAYLVPLLTLIWAVVKFSSILSEKIYLKIFGTIILFLATSSLLSLIFINNPQLRIKSGGMAGLILSGALYHYLGPTGSYVIIITLFILSLHLATEFLILPIFSVFFKKTCSLSKGILGGIKSEEKPAAQRKFSFRAKKTVIIQHGETKEDKDKKISIIKPRIRIAQPNEEEDGGLNVKPPPKIAAGEYKLPHLNLLKVVTVENKDESRDNLEVKAGILEGTLRDFGIEAKVVQIDKGPVVTRYELQPAAGVKVQRIVTLSDDIALAMKALSVRVVAPIPGKDRVGIEVPNSKSSIVSLREVIISNKFKESKSKITLALGKDIAGEPIICDLGTMPHLLIAGTTGSGKTVCVNSIIISILYNATPEEVKFIMVDPKMVELAPFNGLPHLLCPVITNAKKVSAALNWTVTEMENRYKTLAQEGTRNIEAHNKKVQGDKKMPYLVIIIDELADLMVVASQNIENAITRLSQLSRAVGIHIILATQRPSVDVITGVIKANFPTRISFKVASKVDSRTVLDANGADKLLGRGDMLFLPPGASRIIRAQAPLVEDEEIENIVDFIKSQREHSYNEEILKEQEKASSSKNKLSKKDELFNDAIRVVLETKHASVSMLQRRLGLGYTRAARLIDSMEDESIVGPYRGSKPREILVDIEEYLKNKE